MPFDQNSGIGYAVALSIQIFGVLIIGGILCMLNTLFFGVCWYVDTFVRDLADILKRIDSLWTQRNYDEDYLELSLLYEKKTFDLFREFVIFDERIFG